MFIAFTLNSCSIFGRRSLIVTILYSPLPPLTLTGCIFSKLQSIWLNAIVNDWFPPPSNSAVQDTIALNGSLQVTDILLGTSGFPI